MKGGMKMRILGKVFFVGIFLFGLSYVVMRLWNYALSPAIHVEIIDYWQAMALLVLAKILFGIPFRAGRGRRPWKNHRAWKEKFEQMSDEERAQMKARWREHWSRHKGNTH
jgi:hypothetical protein